MIRKTRQMPVRRHGSDIQEVKDYGVSHPCSDLLRPLKGGHHNLQPIKCLPAVAGPFPYGRTLRSGQADDRMGCRGNFAAKPLQMGSCLGRPQASTDIIRSGLWSGLGCTFPRGQGIDPLEDRGLMDQESPLEPAGHHTDDMGVLVAAIVGEIR